MKLIFPLLFILFSCSQQENKNISYVYDYYEKNFSEKIENIKILFYVEPSCETCNYPVRLYLDSNKRLYNYKLIYLCPNPNLEDMSKWKENYKNMLLIEKSDYFKKLNVSIIKSGILIIKNNDINYIEYDPFKKSVKKFLLDNS